MVRKFSDQFSKMLFYFTFQNLSVWINVWSICHLNTHCKAVASGVSLNSDCVMVNTYKVVLCGKTGVGKTSLFRRMCGLPLDCKKSGKTTKDHECKVTVEVEDKTVEVKWTGIIIMIPRLTCINYRKQMSDQVLVRVHYKFVTQSKNS